MAKSFTCWRHPGPQRTAAIEWWTYTRLIAAEPAARGHTHELGDEAYWIVEVLKLLREAEAGAFLRRFAIELGILLACYAAAQNAAEPGHETGGSRRARVLRFG